MIEGKLVSKLGEFAIKEYEGRTQYSILVLMMAAARLAFVIDRLKPDTPPMTLDAFNEIGEMAYEAEKERANRKLTKDAEKMRGGN